MFQNSDCVVCKRVVTVIMETIVLDGEGVGNGGGGMIQYLVGCYLIPMLRRGFNLHEIFWKGLIVHFTC